MYTYISAAISLDGYLSNSSDQRLILSNQEDFDAVKHLRAKFDAILVGAQTIRHDNPALVLRDSEVRRWRTENGMSADQIKVTVTSTGNLSPDLRFFTEGEGTKIVIAGCDADRVKLDSLSRVARVIIADSPHLCPASVCALLEKECVKSLFVEGGSTILTAFLTSPQADYLRLAVAPFFVGRGGEKRFVGAADFANGPDNRLTLRRTYPIGDMSISEYSLKATAKEYLFLEKAIQLTSLSPACCGAYSVGAVVVTAGGEIFTGYSRETEAHNHAEEEAIIKALAAGCSLEGATIYSSMEPCSTRSSKEVSCSELIIAQKIKKVVFAAKEPTCFVNCIGQEMLQTAGIEVRYLKDMEQDALAANRHICDR